MAAIPIIWAVYLVTADPAPAFFRGLVGTVDAWVIGTILDLIFPTHRLEFFFVFVNALGTVAARSPPLQPGYVGPAEFAFTVGHEIIRSFGSMPRAWAIFSIVGNPFARWIMYQTP